MGYWIDKLALLGGAYLVPLALLLIFFGLSNFYVLLIFMKRYKQQQTEKVREKYWDEIEKNLALILIQSMDDDFEREHRHTLADLWVLQGKSPKISQFILNEIIKQKSNLVGEAQDVLLRVYYELNLKSISKKKLKSRKWHRVAQGIRELELMGQKDCFPDFYPFLKARNSELRKVARAGLASLSPNPLSFLDYVNEELNEWEQMAIEMRLRDKKKEDLPSFHHYFDHHQLSVAIFCVRMTEQFKVYEYVPKLTHLLETASGKLLTTVIQSLDKMEAYQTLKSIKHVLGKTSSPEVMIACLRFMANHGNSTCHDLLEECMKHPENEVRTEAVRAAIHLQYAFHQSDEHLERMFYHHKNQLTA